MCCAYENTVATSWVVGSHSRESFQVAFESKSEPGKPHLVILKKGTSLGCLQFSHRPVQIGQQQCYSLTKKNNSWRLKSSLSKL